MWKGYYFGAAGEEEKGKDNDPEPKVEGEKERCSGSYCQAVGFLVIKDDSISKRPG